MASKEITLTREMSPEEQMESLCFQFHYLMALRKDTQRVIWEGIKPAWQQLATKYGPTQDTIKLLDNSLFYTWLAIVHLGNDTLTEKINDGVLELHNYLVRDEP